MQFPGKLTNQTSKNDKKPNFGPDFGQYGPNLVPKIFFVDFTSARSQSLFQAIILCNLQEK